MKTLVVLPTFNEGKNIGRIIERVLGHGIFEVLVVDDHSTDGTPEIVREWMGRSGHVHLIERPGKLGLGTAYATGFKWGLDRGYECFMEMDSDFSHNPDDMPRFVERIEKGAGLVIGSRYIDGTISVVGWDFKRLLLSRFGNIYASTILGVKYSDLTSGYRAYSRAALAGMELEMVKSEGYAFQIEMAYYVHCLGLPVAEIPIIFYERLEGSSKMSRRIVYEAVKLPWRLRIARALGRLRVLRKIN